MPRTVRSLAFLAVCGLALLCTACGSNNKGKIEGKWKIISGPGFDEAMLKEMEANKIYVYVEFTNDGKVNIGAASTDSAVQGKLDKSEEKAFVSCKYKLQSGDKVEFFDLPKELQEKGMFGKNKDKDYTNIKIEGDSMTMTDSDGKQVKLTKVK